MLQEQGNRKPTTNRLQNQNVARRCPSQKIVRHPPSLGGNPITLDNNQSTSTDPNGIQTNTSHLISICPKARAFPIEQITTRFLTFNAHPVTTLSHVDLVMNQQTIQSRRPQDAPHPRSSPRQVTSPSLCIHHILNLLLLIITLYAPID